MGTRLAIFLFDRPRLGLALVALLTLAAAIGISRLRFDDDYLNLIRSSDRSFVALENSYEDFSNEVNDLIVVVDDDDGVIRLPVLRALQRLVRSLEVDPAIGDVVSILDAREPLTLALTTHPIVPDMLTDGLAIEELRDRLLAHPMVGGYLLDANASTTLVLVPLRDEGHGRLPIPLLERRLTDVRAAVADSGLADHARVRLTGPPAMRSVTVDSLARDQLVFASAALLLGLALAGALFRSAVTAVAVIVPAALGVAWTFGVLGLAGEPVNLINGAMAPLLLAISVSDTMHLLVECHRRLRLGEPRHAAVRAALETVAPACILTSVTTAVGFGALVAAEIPLVAGLGAACGAGVFLCLVAVLVLVPRWVVSDVGIDASHPIVLPLRVEPPVALVHLWRSPGAMVVGSVVGFLALLAVAVNVRVDVRATTEVPQDTEAYRAFRHVEDFFGGLLSAHVIVRWPESHTVASRELRTVLDEVHSAIGATGVSGLAFSLLNVEAATRGRSDRLDAPGALFALGPRIVLRRLVEPRTNSALVFARMRDAGARALIPVLTALRAELDAIEARHPGYVLVQTGLMPVHVATIDQLVTTLARSLVLALPLIFIAIAIAHGSARSALAAFIPNVLPLVGIAVYLVAVDWHIGIAGALSFTVALGIAVDDTIHFLEHAQRGIRDGLTPIASVENAWASLMPVMAATTAIFIAGFGTLGASRFTGVNAFGGLCCLAFAVALAADLLILPAWIVALTRRGGAR